MPRDQRKRRLCALLAPGRTGNPLYYKTRLCRLLLMAKSLAMDLCSFCWQVPRPSPQDHSRIPYRVKYIRFLPCFTSMQYDHRPRGRPRPPRDAKRPFGLVKPGEKSRMGLFRLTTGPSAAGSTPRRFSRLPSHPTKKKRAQLRTAGLHPRAGRGHETTPTSFNDVASNEKAKHQTKKMLVRSPRAGKPLLARSLADHRRSVWPFKSDATTRPRPCYVGEDVRRGSPPPASDIRRQ